MPFFLSAQAVSGIVEPTDEQLKRERVQLNRVVDPWSKTTQWIDKYITTSSATNRENKRDIANKIVFNFRVNSILFEADYMDNANSIKLLNQIFSDASIFKDGTLTVITGSASPEGYFGLNENLAAQRAWAIKSFIMWKHPNVNRDRISTYSIGEQWDGLRTMVEQDSLIPGRDQVLQILDTRLAGEEKIRRIKRINNGKTYNYLKNNVLPTLRGGVSCTFYTLDPLTKEPTVVQTSIIEYRDRVVEVEKLRVDTVYIGGKSEEVVTPKTVNKERPERKLFFAVKTNMLYDLALLPNLAIEVPIGKSWSIEAEGMESWWNTDNGSRYYHRVQTAGLEVRRWFRNRYTTPLTGHFFGIYAMGGTYDIKLNAERGSLSDFSYSIGVSYGYSTPIGKRWDLEFALGMGYVAGEYKTYRYSDISCCFPLIDHLNRSYFGPTKAKVSLVYLIGNGFKNRTRK